MKAITLCSLFFSYGILCAQLPVNDSVSLGNDYTSMSFYSMANGEVAYVNANDWDLQFGTSLMDAPIRVNDAANVMLYNLVNSDTINWMSVDTTSMTPIYNADTSWNIGAFNVLSSGIFDYGWGDYCNCQTHDVNGKRIFVIKTLNGNYKKIWVKILIGGDEYKIHISNIDNTDEAIITLRKSDYPGKTSFYYAIDDDIVRDMEPSKVSWDIVFRRYISFVNPPGLYYPVTGALLNPKVTAAEARGVSTMLSDYQAYNFEGNISVIGYDWKGQSLEIIDSLVYFVAAQDGHIYKLLFTGFGGQATGKINFTKTDLTSTTGINDISSINTLTTYPNPAQDNLQVLYTLQKDADVTINVLDLSGKSHFSTSTQSYSGLNNLTLQTADLDRWLRC